MEKAQEVLVESGRFGEIGSLSSAEDDPDPGLGFEEGKIKWSENLAIYFVSYSIFKPASNMLLKNFDQAHTFRVCKIVVCVYPVGFSIGNGSMVLWDIVCVCVRTWSPISQVSQLLDGLGGVF
ncbi:uncharacterized protein Z518_07547 [Rhinocladiella mackenziei CBS 650.93]|uniref:Rhinocladiella mackenziei CBS 650.93 unplaced genomic scaffold supercont1.5, whole genome shotgun sequence n=1 Tax=Rhinocladiella mackenziei CBS 650.93 TaxID=1442369 RepID=A0A0D2IDV4_9EURO|nr:uncharacterized protein Z518_07547 [Rhinocladiella mackenziei CBS 650.93]KIX03994.1 hypothetical protein Z518_07547 [Rhinocladiella mackenziei CBS 650.93]